MKLLDYFLILAATVLGVGSIVLLILGGSVRYFDFGWSEPEILLWDGFLSFVFFAQHSGMVRRSFRVRLATMVAERYHGAIYTIASGIALALFALFTQRSQTMLYTLEGGLLGFARVCSVLAVAIFALSAYSLRSFDPLGLRLEVLHRVIPQCYHRDDRVMRAFGMEPRPPFPKGFEVEQGDWSLLDPVRARPKLYRPAR